MENQVQQPSLDNLLSEQSAPEEQAPVDETQELFERMIEQLGTLGDSLANLHVLNQTLSRRVATLERFVSYLCTKDPEMGPKMKAMAEAAEKSGNNEQVLPNLPPQA